MTDEAIKLIQELGFPIAMSIGLAFALYSVIRYILKEKVEDTLNRFDERHDNLIKELDEIKREMHLRFDQERDDTEKLKKWVSDGRSDNKIIIDYILKGK
ncbi:MAG: hypothetical protein Unbinned4139contig1000_27 [Prokaryotic dsDNA virus sp.]|nr:MAG: hypothetical protein Unbinned4139contig1000_27 [Prokaryotic dsDNA virus sp.]|tara:strand:+ start:9141 stop:9440 length:300 start_codon:yes stop_codon:yes gene_type:complete